MKRQTRLMFATLSTLLLAVGAVRAAEKFDPLTDSDLSDQPDLAKNPPNESRLPTLPCIGPRSSA